MDCYYHSKDLGKFEDMGKGNPGLWEKFMSYYSAVFADGALTERERPSLRWAWLMPSNVPIALMPIRKPALKRDRIPKR